ncbi:MAG: type II toxin-antitoxin system VapC family toxin [Xanthomonadales bacterium]|nr:type II toxin-antitoxin system VapC family toxin [Xanthomonadales bacterium]
MGLVVDTNVFINIENGRIELEALNRFSAYGDTFIAAITGAELYLGVHLASNDVNRVRREAFVESILGGVPSLPFNADIARVYSRIYSIFLKPRSKLGSNVHDLQIAATALAYGYPVLTSNVSDFKKIPGLEVLSP